MKYMILLFVMLIVAPVSAIDFPEEYVFIGNFKKTYVQWHSFLCDNYEKEDFVSLLSKYVAKSGFMFDGGNVNSSDPKIKKKLNKNYPNRLHFQGGFPSYSVALKNMKELKAPLYTGWILETDGQKKTLMEWRGPSYNFSQPVAVSGKVIYFREGLGHCAKPVAKKYWVGVDTNGNFSFRLPAKEMGQVKQLNCKNVAPENLLDSAYLSCEEFTDIKDRSKKRIIISQGPMS